MIHYHGVPITPESDCTRILKGRPQWFRLRTVCS